MNMESNEDNGKVKQGTDLSVLVKEFFFVQKRRIAAQLRITARAKLVLEELTEKRDKQAEKIHKELLEMIKTKRSFEKIIGLVKPVIDADGRWSDNTEGLYYRYNSLEWYVISELGIAIQDNPIWTRWLSKVRGIDKLLTAEIIGEFESALKPGETLGTHFQRPSQMKAFAGLGRPVKTKKGEKASYNSTLKSILLGRLGTSFKMQPMDKSGYKAFYNKEKTKLIRRLKDDGMKIVPSAKLPTKNKKKYEPEGIISEGHVDNMVIRKMIQLFVNHLWEVARKAEGFKDTGLNSYAFAVLGHPKSSYIPPIIDKKD